MADKYDKLLKEGLIRLKESEFCDVPNEDDIEYEFSKNYLKAKEKLLKKLDRSYWKYINTAAKKVAVILFALVIAFSSLMTVDAFRETVLDFIVTIYKTFTQLEASTNEEKQIKKFYSIMEIPTEYSPIIRNFNDAIGHQTWSNNYKQITLSQNLSHTSNQFDSEHGELIEAEINNTSCLVCQDNNYLFCYWEFDGYRFELIYPIDLGEEFMSEVVGHLVEVDPEELPTE